MKKFETHCCELIQHDQFVNYAITERDGKRTKPPVDGHGHIINAQDPATWRNYRDALATSDQIGFVLTSTDPFLFIDLDHVLKEGQLCEWAAKLLSELPTTYTEISPSSDGLHLYYRLNDLPELPGHKKVMDDGTALEIYFSGRYFTITGNVYVESPIATVSWGEL
jgi:primase-polymerase (primpol)-like protein